MSEFVEPPSPTPDEMIKSAANIGCGIAMVCLSAALERESRQHPEWPACEKDGIRCGRVIAVIDGHMTPKQTSCAMRDQLPTRPMLNHTKPAYDSTRFFS